MQLYSQNENYKLYQGNMLDMLEVIEPNSVDSIITDPPYELNFMNKGWDNSGIAFQKETWEKCYEVLKPGGYLLAFGGSRTFHRIACAIEDAGFEIRDTIMWLYGSGFPKSMDISKQIDKKGGNDYSKQFAVDLKQARESRNLTMKYCDDKYCGGTTNWSWYEGRPKGMRVPDYQTYLEIVNDFPELEKYRELIKEAEREVVGTQITNKTVYQKIGQKNESGEVNITIPETDLARKWQGWGTALKPSFEPIIVARKPFKGSLVDNVIEYGVGGINIDECRVGNEERFNPSATIGKDGIYNWNTTTNEKEDYKGQIVNGRFPANTILTYDETDYEEVCGGFPDTKSQKTNSKLLDIRGNNYNNANKNLDIAYERGYTDSGSASRYFMNCKYTGKDEDFRRYIYTPKASKKDRDEGLDEFEEKDTTELLNRKEGTAGILWEQGGTNAFSGASGIKKNTHPTVKPTDLMQYLVRLVTPNGGTILDPFNGSGSTGKAVMYENKEHGKNYKYIGIELTEEYLPISKARIEYVCNLKEEELKDMQVSIFDILNKEE